MGTAVRRLCAAVPRGDALPELEWGRRHRAITGVLWVHVPALIIFALVRGESLLHGLWEVAPVAGAALVACASGLKRDYRVAATAVGLVTCSAIAVHLAGGSIEAHFHFFGVVGLVSLYYDWVPFLVAIGYTAVHHGVVGTVAPQSVYNHDAAINHPWLWALIHAGFVLAASAANLLAWRMNEDDHDRAERAIAELSGYNELILRSAGEGIFGVDVDGKLTFINPAAASMLGWDGTELIGQPIHAVVHHSRSDGTPYPDHECPIHGVLSDRAGDRRQGDEVYWRADGTSFPIEYFTAAMEQDGEVLGAVVTFRDVTDRKDAVTGLEGRAWFLNRADEALSAAEATGRGVAVLFVDVDRFKLINDSMGHASGDQVLVGVARRLQAAVRPTDSVARFGGDEFVVLCDDITHDSDAQAVAAQVLEAFESPLHVSSGPVFLSVSIGVAVRERAHGVAGECLLREADAAMYRAKRAGGRGQQVFNEAMRVDAAERLWLESELRGAVARDEMHIAYQPLIDIETGAISGAEALLRWNHPTRGPITPDQFIPVAEETKLIGPIGAWVLTEACRQGTRWDTSGIPGLNISVNVSAVQLEDPTFVHTVAAVLTDTRFEPSRLCLEITETAVMRDPQAALTMLHALKALGVRLAIDDFGTGYSSLAYLKQLPVDTLKVDRGFVSGVDTGPEDAAIVAASVRLAHTLGMSVVAEGVETEAQLAHLQTLGCNSAQGFYFSRPVPAHAISTLIRRPGDAQHDRAPQEDSWDAPAQPTRLTIARQAG